jgi:putative peptidoglycan lipid II flippase
MSPLAQIVQRFKGTSVNSRILRAATTVTAGGIFVKIVATLKEFVVAGIYGRTDAMDAFLAANLIPGQLINLISESMNQALVPTLIRVREREGHERAQQLLSSSMVSICVLLSAASLIMALTARAFFPLIASHFPPAKFDLSVRLFYGLLPLVIITGIATNCTAVLNTFDRFSLPALAPVTVPLGIMICSWLLSARMGPWAWTRQRARWPTSTGRCS